VKIAKVKSGLLSVVGKGLPFAVPNGPTSIDLVLSLDGGTNTYCMTVTGTGDGSTFLVKDATAGSCAPPAPTPTATPTAMTPTPCTAGQPCGTCGSGLCVGLCGLQDTTCISHSSTACNGDQDCAPEDVCRSFPAGLTGGYCAGFCVTPCQ
jgi:hypothetical protein